MKLNGIQKRVLSLFTMVTFTLGMLAPDALRAASAPNNDMKLVASILSNSRSAYGNQNDGFSHFSKRVLSELSNADIGYIQTILGNVSKMPEISHKNGELAFSSGETTITIKLVNELTGDVLVNGKRFTYKGDQSFKSNFDRMLKVVNAPTVSWVDVLMNSIIPKAHADSDEDTDSSSTKKAGMSDKLKQTIVVALAALIGVGLLVWWGVKAGQEKTEREANANNKDIALAEISRGVNQDNNATTVRLSEIKNGINTDSDTTTGGGTVSHEL